ncbi:MAG: hypothetical protein Q9163_004985 [Psora crenata]
MAAPAGTGDPRLKAGNINGFPQTFIPPQSRLLHDPEVTFEEYLYYAQKTRAEEDALAETDTQTTGILQFIFPPKSTPAFKDPLGEAVSSDGNSPHDPEKRSAAINDMNLAKNGDRLAITDREWTNASRAFRIATWAACFYLITTDILGPFGIGFSMGTLGWGPGIALFTTYGLMAGYSGYLLWKLFLGLDSYEFPLRNYADIAFRLYGSIPRHLVNLLQSIQLLCNVGVLIIASGQALSQVSKFRLCYAVCCLIWALCGFGLGQVRTLQRYGWLANLAIYVNLLVMFISMGVIAHSPPNYKISVLGSAGGAVNPETITPDPTTGQYPPVIHYSAMPKSVNGFVGSINGLMQGVYAYGGAHLFIEFMAEMKRPRDFIKAMWGAQFFIYSVYMIYGCYVYHYQGQYSYQVAYQGVSPYAWQVVGNMLATVSAMIAAGLYGNIGIKVLYNNFFMDLLHAPPLTTRRGKILWVLIVPIYWSIAYIIAAAIPAFFGLVSVVAAFCIVQFTYTFPPALALGYHIKTRAMLPDEGFDPATGTVTLHDRSLKRWARGFVSGPWYINVWNVIYLGGALATAGLGAYAAIMGLISAFEHPQTNAFSCQSPLNLDAASTA